MESSQSHPAALICGVVPHIYPKKDVPRSNVDVLATRLLSANELNCPPNDVELTPVLIAPESPMAVQYGRWLKSLPVDTSKHALPLMVMHPADYARHMGYEPTLDNISNACHMFGDDFQRYGRPNELSMITSNKRDTRPIPVPLFEPHEGTQMDPNRTPRA
jgi:hypothetical protein